MNSTARQPLALSSRMVVDMNAEEHGPLISTGTAMGSYAEPLVSVRNDMARPPWGPHSVTAKPTFG